MEEGAPESDSGLGKRGPAQACRGRQRRVRSTAERGGGEVYGKWCWVR